MPKEFICPNVLNLKSFAPRIRIVFLKRGIKASLFFYITSNSGQQKFYKNPVLTVETKLLNTLRSFVRG